MEGRKRGGRGGGGRRRGGAGVERSAGLRLTAALAAGPARPLCPSFCLPCAVAKRGARHHLQGPPPGSRRPPGARAGPGRLPGAVAPTAAEPRAGDATAARARPPYPFPGRGFPWWVPVSARLFLLLFQPSSSGELHILDWSPTTRIPLLL